MMTEQTADVLVIGAGLAGLAAAAALTAGGARVTVLERKPYIGGRAYSYRHPALEEVIDSQHVLLGCCTNLIDLCRASGAAEHLRWYDEITFLEPGGDGKVARASRIGGGALPAPGHAALSFLRAPMLSVDDKARIAVALTEFLNGYPATDEESFAQFLARTHQSERAVRHFWEPVILGALNDSFERCSTRYAGQVFHESFLKSPEGGRLGIPTLPMTEFYGPVAEMIVRQGAQLQLRASVEGIGRRADGLWQVTVAGGQSYSAGKLLLALPFEQTLRLVQTLPAEDSALSALVPAIQHFVHAPITTIHLWFDRSVVDVDHAALLDTRIQWVFNKTRIRRQAGTGEYLELVISGSFAELHQTREEILSSALRELSLFFPAVRAATLVRSGILKEARATFSVTPGLDRFRPSVVTASAGLYLAGDWTATGWPSTMEGAVRSGRLAAGAMLGRGSVLTPDLRATGLMRLLTR